jgi:uncharacterized protein (DUF58 family)
MNHSEHPAANEPTELIYLPGSSPAPIVVAIGVTLFCLGFFMGWFLYLLGALFFLVGLGAWWKRSNDEISRMRREQDIDTAVIPAKPIKTN